MSDQKTTQITELLHAAQQGDVEASAKLWRVIHDEVYRLAQAQMKNDRRCGTLHPTVLVQEAYLRLMGSDGARWENRRHFFAAAAEAMRRARVDYARKRKSLKRGGGTPIGSLDHDPPSPDPNPEELIAVDEALERLAKMDEKRAEVVKLRYFIGLTVDETAEVLGISPRTVDNHWRVARTWLHRALGDQDAPEQSKR